MNRRRAIAFIVIVLSIAVTGAACSRDPSPAPIPSTSAPAPSAGSPAAAPGDSAHPAAHPPASFINKVWQVKESTGVAPGGLYTFLSEGSLLITSPNTRPAVGSWKYADGRLIAVEEGIEYPVDVLELSDAVFRIRLHSPGPPLEITFVPAPAPPPGTLPDRRY